jgi:hypothetical protein
MRGRRTGHDLKLDKGIGIYRSHGTAAPSISEDAALFQELMF